MIGAKIRNPSLWGVYQELKESEFSPPEELLRLQLEKAKEFLCFAGKNSPYYRVLFQDIGFTPENIQCIEDVRKIPICDKKILIGENEKIHAQYFFPKKFEAETSGTSGAALKFSKNERWDSTNRATMMRAYDWYGVKPWEVNGYLWGFNISGINAYKVKILDFLQNRRRLFNYQPEEILPFARFLKKASFLTGYSSMIYEIAKAINKAGEYSPDDFKKLKLVKGTSESILEVYRKEVLEAFGIRMTSEYGAAEAGLIAFECPAGKLHVNIENIILETNEQNEAIVTNFSSHSFPIIRYNLGDIVELDKAGGVCECGRAHPTIKSLSGRKGASVYGNSNIFPALTFYYVFKNIALESNVFLNYQAFQHEKGTVYLKIEQYWDDEANKHVLAQLQEYFGSDLCVEIEWGATIVSDGNKKTQYFNTTLD